jgi:hypothetical protein
MIKGKLYHTRKKYPKKKKAVCSVGSYFYDKYAYEAEFTDVYILHVPFPESRDRWGINKSYRRLIHIHLSSPGEWADFFGMGIAL